MDISAFMSRMNGQTFSIQGQILNMLDFRVKKSSKVDSKTSGMGSKEELSKRTPRFLP